MHLFIIGLILGIMLVNVIYKKYLNLLHSRDCWRQSAMDLQKKINNKNGYIDIIEDHKLATRQSI